MFDSEFVNRFNLKWKIVDSGCWEWIGSKMPKGYGQMKLPRTRKQEYAHRLAYMLNFGEIPKGLNVCHRCDNPACVNPEHLFLGTSKDNLQDMKSKGRHLYGERNSKAILTDDSVRKIKQLLLTGLSQTKIAQNFNVAQITISKIKRRERWAHIDPEDTPVYKAIKPAVKLTDEQIKQVKIMLDANIPQTKIALAFDVSQTEISRINRGRR